MPIEYSIDESLGLVRTTAWDTLTEAEWLAYDRQLAADPSFHADMNQLSDFTRITDIDISPEGRIRVALAAPFSKHSKRAAVTPSDLAFGLGRVYEAYSAFRAGVRVFRTKEEAVQWLGLSARSDPE